MLYGRRLDFLYRMSPYEWRGCIENGEIFILIEYKFSLVQIDVQKREMNLGLSKKAVVGCKRDSFNIYHFCEFMMWEWDAENIMD